MDILEDRLLKSNNFLTRCLRVNNFNVDKAITQAVNYVEIRKKHDVEGILSETFPKEFSDNFVAYAGGFDKAGRPGNIDTNYYII